jgi:hypothetical protein
MNKNNNQDGLFMTFEQKELFCQFSRIWELNPEFKDKKFDKFLEAYWKDKDKITPEELLEKFTADFKAGKLFCRETGKERGAGRCKKYKSVQIYIGKKQKSYPFHVVLWTMYNGRWPAPDKIIDHIDRNSANNSISNLFEATYERNANNKNIKNYKSGVYKVINKDGLERYRVARCNKYLGYFKTYEEAMACSLAYSKQLEDQGITPAS